MKSLIIPHCITVPSRAIYAESATLPATHSTNKGFQTLYKLLDDHFEAKNSVNNLIHNLVFKQTLVSYASKTSASDDPFELINDALRLYKQSKKNNAEKCAQQIIRGTDAVEFIKRKASAYIASGLSHTAADEPEWRYQNKNDPNRAAMYQKSSSEFGWGEKEVEGKGEGYSWAPNYQELFQIESIIDNRCDAEMAEIHAYEQKLKNELYFITTTQQEVHSLRQYIVNISKK